jgi:uncharacterized membrane protein AbrB (regulator of aidB expression)
LTLFLFAKLIFAIAANIIYQFIVWKIGGDFSDSHLKKISNFFFVVIVPFISHCLISKWELAIYVALPINLSIFSIILTYYERS